MKILIITHYFPPLNSIASHRPYSWAKYWKKMGHEITILTPRKIPSSTDLDLPLDNFNIIEYDNLYTTLKSKIKGEKKYNNDLKKINTSNTLRWIGQYTKKIIAKWGVLLWDARKPNIFNSGKKDAYAKVKNDWDLVISTFAPSGSHEIAYKLKLNGYAKKWVMDYRDLWTQSHLYSGLFPFNFYEKYIEKRMIREADLITTVSSGLAEILNDSYLIDSVVIENGFDLDDLEEYDFVGKSDDDYIRITHTGSIYSGYRDPSPLFEALKKIECKNPILLEKIKLVFVGGNQGNLLELINAYQVSDYVEATGPLERKIALEYQRKSDVLILLEFPGACGVLTGKIFEYLFAATEIWGIGINNNSAIGEVLNKSGHGKCLGTDVSKIEAEIMRLAINGKSQIKVNHDFINKYTRENLAKKLMSLL